MQFLNSSHYNILVYMYAIASRCLSTTKTWTINNVVRVYRTPKTISPAVFRSSRKKKIILILYPGNGNKRRPCRRQYDDVTRVVTRKTLRRDKRTETSDKNRGNYPTTWTTCGGAVRHKLPCGGERGGVIAPSFIAPVIIILFYVRK